MKTILCALLFVTVACGRDTTQIDQRDAAARAEHSAASGDNSGQPANVAPGHADAAGGGNPAPTTPPTSATSGTHPGATGTDNSSQLDPNSTNSAPPVVQTNT